MDTASVDEKNKSKIRQWDSSDDNYLKLLSNDSRLYNSISKSSLKQPSVDNYKLSKPKYQWFERPEKDPPLALDSKVKLLYPKDTNNLVDQIRNKLSISPPIRFQKFHYKDAAQVNEELVPIRLDFDQDYLRLKEVFCYNLKEPHITPKLLAISLCHDFGLNEYTAAHHIEKAIIDQLDEWKSNVHEYLNMHGPSTSTNVGLLDQSELNWWNSIKNDSIPDDINVKEELDTNIDQELEEDIRILIKLDIVHPPNHLIDQFEWPLSTSLQEDAPELFATNFALELGLPGEFITSISHNIREQSSFYLKSLSKLNHPIDEKDSLSKIPDEDFRKSFLPQLIDHQLERTPRDAAEFTPKLEPVSSEDLITYEKDLEKDNRRRKRLQKNRKTNSSILTQDREPIKTFRTLPQFPETYISVPHSFLKDQPVVGGNNQNNQQLPTNYPRRAAAAKASLNISTSAQAELADIDNNPEDEDYGGEDSHFDNFNSTMQFNEEENRYVQKPLQIQPFDQSKMAITKRPRFIQEVPTKIDYNPIPRLREGAKMFTTGNNKAMKYGHGIAFKKDLSPGVEVKKLSAATINIYSYFSTENQHENIINGIWHCSNCGVPEMYAIGRRKGPMGDKSLCGECGKYLHKMRKNKPVVYNNDPEYHKGLREQMERENEERNQLQKANAQRYRKEMKASRQAQKVAKEAEQLDFYSNSHKRKQDLDFSDEDDTFEYKRGKRKSIDDDEDDDDYNEGEEESLPQTRSQRHRQVQLPPQPSPTSSQSEAFGDTSKTRQSQSTPTWLSEAAKQLRLKYPNDQFIIVEKPSQAGEVQEWRIKCLDCPGKMYTPGPGMTVENFEKHLKNRQHKQKLMARLGITDGLSPLNGPSTSLSPMSHPHQQGLNPLSRPSSSHQTPMQVAMSQAPSQQTDILAAAMQHASSQHDQPAPQQSQGPSQLYNQEQFINIPHDLQSDLSNDLPGDLPNSLDISNIDMDMIGLPSFDFNSQNDDQSQF
ncbi:SNF5-domain-containing protein [Wallemia mellicola]|uniref:SNF5-domain-containing protein n=1 Tax=Wallemia mellicola TaxID=1708541 RepID=A0AB74KCU1_9BASI|nr:hypothetical protein E3Q24_03278 [Wallemia mellicola]TIB83118.1 SNF5-domain-containing protein [Wallemia mellicola]TIB85828.1 SNF5-domain-containing protein [Wallemia mellicola]TIC21955.1 SNF5-domain-containing protein [Wallemia mellicola]TIC39358.1 SNF5-domain-containing protein [Wallemia mellicola]